AGFIICACAIWLGVRRKWNETTQTGTVLFAIFLYTKFFDWWWDAIPKYLFFFLLGLFSILLISVFRRMRLRLQADGSGEQP
ncbi:MAG: hypothetical protein ACRYF5_08895, partial [Janthinobacterium lividum]